VEGTSDLLELYRCSGTIDLNSTGPVGQKTGRVQARFLVIEALFASRTRDCDHTAVLDVDDVVNRF